MCYSSKALIKLLPTPLRLICRHIAYKLSRYSMSMARHLIFVFRHSNQAFAHCFANVKQIRRQAINQRFLTEWRKMMEKVELNKEQRKDAMMDIQDYFYRERGEKIGNLGADIMLDFILEKIAPYIYNKAISDAQKCMADRVDDMYALML
jgi:uncharacterized protein (DUF2164 family)